MNTKELSPICRQVRRDIITMTANAGSGHPGGSLSAVELMTSVFFNHMRGCLCHKALICQLLHNAVNLFFQFGLFLFQTFNFLREIN